MEHTTQHNQSDSLVIAQEVIAAIAVNAAKDVEGVGSFVALTQDMQTLLTLGEYPLRSVKVHVQEGRLDVELFLQIKSGYKIPTVASAVQKSVKNALQSMTGKTVGKVDVHVTGIEFPSQAQ